ncbi:uncharacterized protein LY89DRAFT_259503 [Mollisia scopiformis]|uniref:Uncharacterized protein n=1 Tax=Mollisia scopiformis TaxID=149040 RepID=A0A132BDC3_MOLSC|nr:uncharacterized protein LY89DRAFT_259503 [Mollisia scopiformis]KUJ10371.1 hypothetical protein LY89DRAFT_259503 [Mollisia scopiformis]
MAGRHFGERPDMLARSTRCMEFSVLIRGAGGKFPAPQSRYRRSRICLWWEPRFSTKKYSVLRTCAETLRICGYLIHERGNKELEEMRKGVRGNSEKWREARDKLLRHVGYSIYHVIGNSPLSAESTCLLPLNFQGCPELRWLFFSDTPVSVLRFKQASENQQRKKRKYPHASIRYITSLKLLGKWDHESAAHLPSLATESPLRTAKS